MDLSDYRVKPGAKLRLNQISTDEDGGLSRDEAEDMLDDLLDEMDELQERLYAERERSLLVVLQAMDAGGKDSTIRNVFGPLNPQGVRVASFKVPTPKESRHDFLWRIHRKAPEAGMIRVFNRSHYESVLIEKVKELAPKEQIAGRYAHIRNFEALLEDAGTTVVKVMLNISKDYQLERFRRRLRRPDKHWKFNPGDLDDRALWVDYMKAFEKAMSETSTETAPWYIVPAETRWYRNLVVAQIVRDALAGIDPQYPEPDFDPAAFDPDELE